MSLESPAISRRPSTRVPYLAVHLVALLSIVAAPAPSAQLPGRSEYTKLDPELARTSNLERQFDRGLVKVTEDIHVAVGYGASNSVLIEGDDGVVIVDTLMGTEEARHVREAFEAVTAKPVRAIVYTHGHSDHTGGAAVFAEGSEPVIFGRGDASARLQGYDILNDVLGLRAARQFGSKLEPPAKVSGIAPVHRPRGGLREGRLVPTHIVASQRERVSIAGIEFELIHAPGETVDHQVVWLSRSAVLICGDNFYWSFPNLYAIRGTPYRDIARWIHTLDQMILLDAEHLIPGHARPISGHDRVREILTNYRDAISYVLERTLRGANQGLGPDALAETIILPDTLAQQPYLQEFYGVVSWSVRSIYAGYLGWFDGNPSTLFPPSPTEKARHMAALAGSPTKLLEVAEEALRDEEPEWACELADHLLALGLSSPRVRGLKASALRLLAERQMSSNARHYYLSVAAELDE